MARVLVVEESEGEAKRLAGIFQVVKVPVEIAPNIEVALERIMQDPPALLIAAKPDRPEILHSIDVTLRAHAPATPYLITLRNPKMEMAMEAMQFGAFDCLAKPYAPVDVLMAAKRATIKSGRMLFVKKLELPKSQILKILSSLALAVILFASVMIRREGPPFEVQSLGSVNLSGLQWEGRSLWVGDWFESTATRYEAEKSLLKKRRVLQTRNIYKMQDGQPILVCNTPDLIVTVGSDLKIRIHQRAVGLPTFQTVPAPGVSPSGITWDGKNLWTCDNQTNLLYKHSQDLRVIDTIKSILPQPMGLAWDGTGIWVIGDKPLQVAKLDFESGGTVWHGPVPATRLLPEGISPSGFTVGFGRLWAVSGGDPHMTSIPLPLLMRAAPVRRLKSAPEKEKK